MKNFLSKILRFTLELLGLDVFFYEDVKRDRSFKQSLKEIVIDVIVVLILVVVIRQFVFAPFRVNGPSMCDTFNVYDEVCISGDGEFVITSRFSTYSIFGWTPGDVERGDVLIFQAPYSVDGEFFIKRVIGLAGDTLKIEGGYVYLQNEEGVFEELEEEYLSADNDGKTFAHRSESQTFTVPEDEYFVLGDNRSRSSDSRRCFKQLGCQGDSSPYLPSELIEGEVKLVVFPFSHFRMIQSVDY
jgi:signal peptidase I